MELLLFCSELDSSFHPFFQEAGALGLDLKRVTKEDFLQDFPHQCRNSSEGPPWMPNFVSIFYEVRWVPWDPKSENFEMCPFFDRGS